MNAYTVHIGGRKHINPEDVNYFKADINYTIACFDNGKKIMVATGIGLIQNRLQAFPHFFRINKGIIINLEKVLKHSQQNVSLLNGEIIKVARRRQKGFLELIKTQN